jgi:hypothetical protein
LKIAPTVSSLFRTTVQLFGPAAVIAAVGVQLYDHPPKLTPDSAGAVNVTAVPAG